jgi:hypothetical protein
MRRADQFRAQSAATKSSAAVGLCRVGPLEVGEFFLGSRRDVLVVLEDPQRQVGETVRPQWIITDR